MKYFLWGGAEVGWRQWGEGLSDGIERSERQLQLDRRNWKILKIKIEINCVGKKTGQNRKLRQILVGQFEEPSFLNSPIVELYGWRNEITTWDSTYQKTIWDGLVNSQMLSNFIGNVNINGVDFWRIKRWRKASCRFTKKKLINQYTYDWGLSAWTSYS